MPVLRYVVIDPGCKTYTTTFEEAFLWARELAKDGPLVEIKVEVWDKEPHNPEADIQETHSFAIMDPKRRTHPPRPLPTSVPSSGSVIYPRIKKRWWQIF